MRTRRTLAVLSLSALTLIATACGEPPTENTVPTVETQTSVIQDGAQRGFDVVGLGDRLPNISKNNFGAAKREGPRIILFSEGPADDASDDEDDPRFVRETGFRPVDDGLGEVRETGFLPPPRLILDRIDEDGTAVVHWDPVPMARGYVVEGVKFERGNNASVSFEVRTEATEVHLETDGRQLVVVGFSVGADGKRRSSPSGKLSIIPALP